MNIYHFGAIFLIFYLVFPHHSFILSFIRSFLFSFFFFIYKHKQKLSINPYGGTFLHFEQAEEVIILVVTNTCIHKHTYICSNTYICVPVRISMITHFKQKKGICNYVCTVILCIYAMRPCNKNERN